MTISQLIEKELKVLFPTILNSGRVNLSPEEVMNSPNIELFDALLHIKGSPGIDKDEYDTLYDILLLFGQCELPESEIDIGKEFGQFIERYPNTLLFQYFRIYFTAMSIITGDFEGEDIVEFYRDVFDNFPDFFIGGDSDFLERSNLLESTLLLVNPPMELLNLIENAIKRFSVSNLKFALAQLLYQKQDYQKALLYFLHFVGQVETELPLDNYTQEQYLISISNIANISFYQIKDYENASLYAEACLSEYEKNGEDIYSFQYLFLDPILIHLRLCINNKDNEGFKQIYTLVRSKIDDVDFKELDIDDIKEFENELKM